jgi:hypothetical protein
MFWEILGLMIIFLIVGTALIVYGFKSFHQYQFIRDTPTSKIRSIAMGLVEIVGIVVGARYIQTPFSKLDCVYYSYYVEEYQIESSRDADGDIDIDHTWKTISKGERRIPFYVADETGDVYIEPKGAKIDAQPKNEYYQDRGSGMGRRNLIYVLREYDNSTSTSININTNSLRQIDPNQSIFKNTKVGDRRYYESYIGPDEKLYIIGTATRNPESDPEILIKKGENEPIFLISYKSEKNLSSSLKTNSVLFLLIGSILLVLGIIMLFYSMIAIG